MLRDTAAPGGRSLGAVEGPKKSLAVEEPADTKIPSPPLKCNKPDCPEEGLLETISAGLAKEEKPDDKWLSEFSRIQNPGNRFAIALVPDPVHTHLSLFFDRQIDAIQGGAQQGGWMFDRATMPWDNQDHPESTDFRIRAAQKADEHQQEKWPGLMIFRRANEPSPEREAFLYVLVVAETPTGGINKAEFRNALKIIKGAAHAPDPLRIIGPTFSGSLFSLVQLINQQAATGQFKSVVVRSGTVSSWETMQWFEDHKGDNVDFATFQQSDRFMLRKFVEYEKGRGYAPRKIAVLTEDETAYGNTTKPQRQGPGITPCPDPHGSPTTLECQFAVDENAVLHLYFPRDISQLRSAYQQGLSSKASSSSDSYQVRSTLPLNLQDTGNDDDTVQQFAQSETPLSQEAVLIGIVAAMRERHIEFVVVKATNPMDTLFLTAFLKKGYSQARVVTMPADLLLSRDADDIPLFHGVMALTTYSLLPDIDENVALPTSLANGGRSDHTFSNAYSAGTFNATLSQITCLGTQPCSDVCGVHKTGSKLPIARYAEYGWPLLGGPKQGAPLSPVVWLTALGRDGFWPVAVLGDDPAGEVTASPPPVASVSREPWNFPPPWPLFFGMVSGFVLLLILGFLVLLRKGSILASSATMTLLAPVQDPCRSALIVFVGCLLAAELLLLIWPWVAWPVWGWVRAWVGVCVLLMLYAACTVELVRRQVHKAGWIFISILPILLFVLTLVRRAGGHAHTPFLYRYVHLTSGVSPLLPFLCLLAAGLWWGWFSLTGLSLVDKRRPRLPHDKSAFGMDGPEQAGVLQRFVSITEASSQKLLRVMQPFAQDFRIYILGISVLIVALAAFDWENDHPLLSLETRHFEWIYAAALMAVMLGLFSVLSQLLIIWLECRKILGGLDRIPLRRAFAELHFSWEPIWRLGGGRWQDLYRLVSRQLETLGHLKGEVADKGCQQAETLTLRIEETERAQDALSLQFRNISASGSHDPNSKEPRRSDYLIGEYKKLQEKIAQTCGAALGYLQNQWSGDEGIILSEITSSEQAKSGVDGSEISLTTRLAERFVALVYLNFLHTAVLRMRTLALTAAGLYVFLLLSVNSYPFEPKIALRSGAILLLIFVVGVVGYVSAQGHRDSILSLVTQTTPGELGIEFWLRMGTFVALPLLSLLVSQFPTLNNAVFSWLEPAANALK